MNNLCATSPGGSLAPCPNPCAVLDQPLGERCRGCPELELHNGLIDYQGCSTWSATHFEFMCHETGSNFSVVAETGQTLRGELNKHLKAWGKPLVLSGQAQTMTKGGAP